MIPERIHHLRIVNEFAQCTGRYSFFSHLPGCFYSTPHAHTESGMWCDFDLHDSLLSQIRSVYTSIVFSDFLLDF